MTLVKFVATESGPLKQIMETHTVRYILLIVDIIVKN